MEGVSSVSFVVVSKFSRTRWFVLPQLHDRLHFERERGKERKKMNIC